MRGSDIVLRALGAARRANLAAAGEAPPVAGSAAPTRRAVLKALGTGAALATLPRPSPAMAATGRVAIVGGGIAGLAALWRLTQAGIDAHLYEARARLGGRMFTRRAPDGQCFEDGGQLVNTDHADIQALAQAFRIALVDRKGAPHRSLVLAGGRAIDEAALAEGLRPIAAQIALDADRLDKDYAAVAAQLDRLSIAAYLDVHAAMLGPRWVRGLLEMTCRTEYGSEPEDASALELIFNLPTVGGERVEVLGGSDERYQLAGGSSALIEAMAARLADRITLGKRLARVDPGRANRAGGGVRLAFHDGSVVAADRAIVTVPAPVLRQIDFGIAMPPLWRAYIAGATLGRNEKIHAIAGATPWTEPLGSGGEVWQTDAAIGHALGWEGSVRGIEGSRPGWTWFLGGGQVAATALDDPAAASARFAGAIEGAVPGIGNALTGPFRRTAWHRDALTMGSYSNARPGMLSRFGGLMWTEDGPAMPVLGNLVLAGEHLSDAWPGYMNGGAQTGRLAADAVLAAMGRRAAA